MTLKKKLTSLSELCTNEADFKNNSGYYSHTSSLYMKQTLHSSRVTCILLKYYTELIKSYIQ